MSLGIVIPRALRACFPRVSGDEPYEGDVEPGFNVFSPRERG